MFPPAEETASTHCPGYREQHPPTILYNILSWRDSFYLSHDNNDVHSWNCDAALHRCHCGQRRAVCLKNPKVTCQVACAVLGKTIRFMRSLPSFSQLLPEDQLSMLRVCWVPLFVLGLAQERIAFEVTDAPDSSLLRQILLNGQRRTEKDDGDGEDVDDEKRSLPTVAGVHKLKSCLHKLWNLDLSPKEYAYLKGTLLFNPDVPGLRATVLVEGLQREAQRALREVTQLLHPGDATRFGHILLVASAAQTAGRGLVTELFFKPVIGPANLLHLLSEMLLVRDDWNEVEARTFTSDF